MSRRRPESYIEIRTPDGLQVTVELPSEQLIRAVLEAIGEHRGQPRRRLRAVNPAEGDSP